MPDIKERRRKADLKISGMSCASCAATIENALLEKDGVTSASVNLGSETARVEFDPTRLRLKDLEASVRDAGYDVINERVVLKIGGMVCATCVSAVEEALYELDGVAEASVNLSSEKASVTFNPRITTIGEIKQAIEDAGYQYLGIFGEDSEDRERQERERAQTERRRRIIVGFGASILLMALMYHMYLPFHILPMGFAMDYAMLIISTPAFLYVSHPIFRAAYRALKNRNLNMDVMYSMGIGVAYVSSVMGTFWIILTPDFMFYETAVMLAAFLTLGRYMEAGAKGRTSDSIRKLMELSAREAVVIKDGTEIRIPIESVAVDDVIMVRPGEKVPTDGVVIDGESYVDEAMVSGEPVPARKSEGSTVIGGTINKNSALKIRATRVGKDTLLSQIIDLVEQASGSRPPIQRLADRVVAYFIPVVIAVALGSFLIWYIVLKESLLYSLTAFISVLVVACPCALGLATPTAVTVGIGRGAELGILIKSGEALEAADRLTDIVYDKTGTLTIGRPMVTDILPINSTSTELLSIVAAAERPSEHPLASAVVTRARDEGIAIGEVSGFNEFPGKGVVADLLGAEIVVGNHSFMAERGLLSGDVEEGLMELERQGKTVVYAASSGQLKGAVAIADRLKDSARQAIAAQMRMGLGATMVTGDNRRSAAFIAGQIGISQVYAEVLPQDKAVIVETLQKKGSVVAFVGDGINDAPAMAQSELGIAIGSGTDIAIESSEIVLMRDDLNDVVASIQLSRKVMSRIRQNIFWAFAYNAALIPVAAGALWPLFGITFRPEMAGFAMALSSVTVVSLSLMLKRYTPEAKKALG